MYPDGVFEVDIVKQPSRSAAADDAYYAMLIVYATIRYSHQTPECLER